MKKILMLILVAIMTIGLVSCVGGNGGEENNNNVDDNIGGDNNNGGASSSDVQLWFWDESGYFRKDAEDMSLKIYEPAAISIVYVKVANTSALVYEIMPEIEITEIINDVYRVLDYYFFEDGFEGNKTRADMDHGTDLLKGKQKLLAEPIVLEAGEVVYFAVAVKMDEAAGQEYMDSDARISFKVSFEKKSGENDSFDGNYDGDTDNTNPGDGKVEFPDIDL